MPFSWGTDKQPEASTHKGPVPRRAPKCRAGSKDHMLPGPSDVAEPQARKGPLLVAELGNRADRRGAPGSWAGDGVCSLLMMAVVL